MFKRVLSSRWGPLLMWSGVIFLGSTIPGASIADKPWVDLVLHKSVHVAEYFFLYLVAFRAFGRNLYWPLVFAVFYGLTDEAHQLLVPGRAGRLRDVGVDAFGSLLALIYLWKFYPKVPRKLRTWLNAF